MHKLHFFVHRKLWLLLALVVMTLLLGAIAVTPQAGIVAAQGPHPQRPQVALGTGFTYQGQLKKSGVPVNGTCTMTFTLWDSQSSGTQVGGPQMLNSVAVAGGLFTVVLDSSNELGAFGGSDRWLETAVKCAGDGSAVTLSRQELTATPYALFSAAPWVTSGSNLTYNAGSVGIGTALPTAGIKLEVNGETRLTPGGAEVEIGLGTPNAETGMSILGPNRADLRFDGTTLKLVVGTGTGPPPSTNGINIATSGNVGIGTVSPAARLTVRGPDTSLSSVAFRVETASGNVALQVYDDTTVGIQGLYGSSTSHACYVFATVSRFGLCSSAAEYVPTMDEGAGFVEAADLVSIAPTVRNPYGDEHSPFVVTKSSKPCDDNLLGFIVNPESGADGKKLNEHYLPLAIYGYFPAKVTLENGAIKRGDPLTSSSKPGYGMKATQACKIIGYALEDAEQEGIIQVFANHGENAAPEVAALRTQVETQAEQIAAQQKQIDALVTKLTALEQSAKSGGASTPASR
jgi:hypothetical protein